MSESLPRTDELLSAYLDGELTEVERAQVEAWLADDPRAQSLLEELQGVSAAVKSLPTARLGTDLTSSVLARVGDNGAPRHDDSRHEEPDHDESDRDAAPSLPLRDHQRRFSGRGLWWSAAAIAAAIAIALFVPQPGLQDQAPIAQQAPRAGGAGEMSARGVDPAPTGEVADSTPSQFDFGSTDAPAPLTTSSEAPAPPLARTLPTPPPPAPAGEEAGGIEPGGDPAPMRGGSGGEADSALAKNTPADEASPTQYLVVWVDVPPQALERRAIDQVFASNNIAVESESDDWQTAAEPVRTHVANRVATRRGSLSYAEEATPQGTAADTPFAAASQIAAEGEAIWVEATWEQVNETLKQLQADPRNFDSVTIETVTEPAPNESSEVAAGDARQFGEEESVEGAAAGSLPAAPEAAAPDRATLEPPPRQRSSDAEPTAEPPQPPATGSDRAIRSAPPDESPPESALEGRYSVGQDRLEEETAAEAAESRLLGRARRLQVVTRDKESALAEQQDLAPPSTNAGVSRSDEKDGELETERPKAESAQSPTPSAPPTQLPLGRQQREGQQRAESKAASRPNSVQVLFVLRSRPPEIAAEAAPAPAPPAPPEGQQ